MKRIASWLQYHWLKTILFLLVACAIWWLVPVRPSLTLPGGDSLCIEAFSPDGQLIVTSTNRREPAEMPGFNRRIPVGPIKLWEVASGRERQHLTTNLEDVVSDTFSPDGKLLAVLGFERPSNKPMLELWDVARGVIKCKLEADYRTRQVLYYTGPICRFSPDGKTLAVIAPQKQIKLVDTETGQVRATFSQASRMVLSNDGLLLATSLMQSPIPDELQQQNPVQLWNVSTGQLQMTLTGHKGPAQALAFSPDGKHLATGTPGYQGNNPPEIKLWDITTGKEEFAVTGHLNADTDIRSISIEGNGRILCMKLSTIGQARLWDTQASPPQMLSISCDDLAFSSDGKLMAFSNGLEILGKRWKMLGGKPGPTSEESQAMVTVWDTETMKVHGSFRPNWPAGSANIMGFVPGSHSVMLKGTWMKEQAGIMHAIRRFAHGRIGEKWLDETEFKMFDARTGQEQGLLEGSYDIHFAPDGRHLCAQDVITGSGIMLFDLPFHKSYGLLMGLWAGAAILFLGWGWASERRRQKALLAITTSTPSPPSPN